MEAFLFSKKGTLEAIDLTREKPEKFFSDKISVFFDSKTPTLNIWVGENTSGTEKKQIPLIGKIIKENNVIKGKLPPNVVKQRQETHEFLLKVDETKGKIRYPEDVWEKLINDSAQAVFDGLKVSEKKIDDEDLKGTEIEIKKYLTLASLSGKKDLMDEAIRIKAKYLEKEEKFFRMRVEELTEKANETLATGDISHTIVEFDKIKEIVENRIPKLEN
jgi:hypothetical protein